MKVLALDLNGTMAIDQKLVDGVIDLVLQLTKCGYQPVVITADRYQNACELFAGTEIPVRIVSGENVFEISKAKGKIIEEYRSAGARIFAVGNCQQDQGMLEGADFSILIWTNSPKKHESKASLLQNLGQAQESITNSPPFKTTICCPDIMTALKTLLDVA